MKWSYQEEPIRIIQKIKRIGRKVEMKKLKIFIDILLFMATVLLFDIEQIGNFNHEVIRNNTWNFNHYSYWIKF